MRLKIKTRIVIHNLKNLMPNAFGLFMA